MADVTFHCLNCSKTVTISQFVDQSNLTCPDCGSSLRLASPVNDFDLKNSQLNVKHNRGPQTSYSDTKPDSGPTQSSLMEGAFNRHLQKPKKGKMGKSYLQVVAATIVFLIVGGTMFTLRYSAVAPMVVGDYIADYGIWVVVVGHIVLVSIAMKDGFMQGLLCLLIPLYSLYYLLICDHIFLRAIFLGLLVGIGQDAGILIAENAVNFYDSASDWIGRGGM